MKQDRPKTGRPTKRPAASKRAEYSRPERPTKRAEFDGPSGVKRGGVWKPAFKRAAGPDEREQGGKSPGSRPPFKRAGDSDERRPYVKREGFSKPAFKRTDSEERRPYVKREGTSRPPFKRAGDTEERRPFVKREGFSKPPFKRAADSDERRPYVKREGSSRPPFKRAGDSDERRPFAKREGLSKPPLKRSADSDERRPYVKREGTSRPPFKRAGETEERRSFVKREGFSKPPFKRESDSEERPPFVKREGFSKPPFKRAPESEERRPFLKGRAPFKRASESEERRPFVKGAGSAEFGGRPPRAAGREEYRERPQKSAFSKREPAVLAIVKKAQKLATLPPPESKGPKSELKTLDRVLSKAGLGSRTEARSWIGAGRVRVNGLLVQTPDYWVNLKTDKIALDEKPVDIVERRYVLLNKPKGYLTTYKDPENRPTVYDLLTGIDQFLGTVGRLDLDTSGLLLLTNDNDLAEAMTNPAYKLEKTYLVKSATLLSEEQIDRLRKGVELEDGPTRPAVVELKRNVGTHTFLEMTITEGRNRQVRRMLEAVESKVLKLVRVRLGPLNLENMPLGTWRDLTEEEVTRLASGRVRPKTKLVPEDEEDAGD